VACHRGIDIRIGWLRHPPQECSGGHDLPGLTVAALGYVVLDPRGLHRVELAFRPGQSLDRGDRLPCCRCCRYRTRAHGLAIEMNGARATLRDTAPILRADEAKMIPEHPQERRGLIESGHVVLFPVDVEAHE